MPFPEIDDMIARARAAMDEIAGYSQAEIDAVVTALAWAIYRDDHAKYLAELAVEDTGLGNVDDKIIKNKRKTYGTLVDLMQVQTVGLVDEDPGRGLYTYYKPVGVVGTLTPSTNPAATPANQALMAVKGGNALIVSPSPAARRTADALKEYFDAALDKVGAPRDLFQVVPAPINFDKANYLCEQVDLVLVTGDQVNVRRGYKSGTPCIGVGKGNVPVIVDDSADLIEAARMITASKTFDNATSCSSENAVVVLDAVYDDFLDALQSAGGLLASDGDTGRVEEVLFQDGKVNRRLIGKGMDVLADAFDLGGNAAGKKFVIVEQSGIGPGHPLSGEKLSLVLALYRAPDIDAAIATCGRILDYEGRGHSVGIHTAEDAHAFALAERLPAARVLVNQAHTFGNGGGMNNHLPFTLTMGCGTWAGNSISENLSIKNFVNKTVLVKTVDKAMPTKPEMFGALYEAGQDALGL